MAHSGQGGDEGAGTSDDGLVPDRELDLALEDVEGVRVGVVDVRRHRTELGRALELEHLELLALGLDDELTVLTRDLLALAGA